MSQKVFEMNFEISFSVKLSENKGWKIMNIYLQWDITKLKKGKNLSLTKYINKWTAHFTSFYKIASTAALSLSKSMVDKRNHGS